MSVKKENSNDNLPNMINSILERFRSPFAGNFIITWLTINWEIPYITLFLDQDHTGFSNKLVAVKDVLEKTPICNLIFYPFAITCFLILAIPGLNYLASQFPSYLKFKKSKEETEKEQELSGLKNQASILRSELNQLNKLTTNDLLIKIGYKEESIDNIFPGSWKIFIEYAKRSSNHNSCYMKENTFIDDDLKTPLLTIKSITPNSSGSDRRPIAICTIGQTNEEIEYYFHISKREEIIFQEKGNHMNRIIFNWTNMPNY